MPRKKVVDSTLRITADGKVYRRGKKHYTNKDTYEGEFVDSMRHGRGLLTRANGDRFQGEFEKNLFHGYGVQSWAPYLDENFRQIIGKRYEGDYKFGLKHGKGIFLLGTGDIYTGMFERDLFHGEGTLKTRDGDKFTGEWIRGKPGGKMTVLFSNRDKYEGEMMIGKYHGHGKIVYHNGKGQYEGHWIRGRAHGTGTRLYANGNKYLGNFADGEPDAEGTMFYINGDQYIGQWKQGHFHGKGVLRYMRGDQYEGSFLHGAIYGEGTYRYSDGGYYTGEFRNVTLHPVTRFPFPECDGKRHGFGLRVWTNGNQYQGEWKLDKMDGQGTLTTLLGTVYEGNFRNNLRHGYGKENFGNKIGERYVCPMGRRHTGDGYCNYIGLWSAGLFHGQGEFTCKDGRCYHGEWKMGKRNGTGKQTYLRDGDMGDDKRLFIGGIDSLYRIKEYDGSWLDDVREGMGLLTYVNGDTLEGNFVNGQPHGLMVCSFVPKFVGSAPASSPPPKRKKPSKAIYNNGYRVEWGGGKLDTASKFINFLSAAANDRGLFSAP